ncbi:MAG TPA: hypothetical protein VGS27_15300 [Candidatus Sulfotelmatobacter sp.]|nr:hypothetical protein [Candidatus Sulfotelmatobacter sp.]
MRQILMVLSVVLLGLSWAVAQGSSTPSSPGYGAQQGTQSGQDATMAGSGHQTRTNAGGQMTVEGCLSGSNGNYTLSDKNGTTYQLTGDTAKLSEHVGHEVKITGTSGSAAAGSSASTGAGSTGASGAGQTLEVSSVKHISKTCKSGAGGMTH